MTLTLTLNEQPDVPWAADVEITIARLRDRLRAVPHVVKNPEPLVQVLTLNQTGVVLSVRPFCHHDHYWQVYFDANKAIVEVMRLEQPA